MKINKYFGVVIDNSLNWKEHIKTVSAMFSTATGFLRHAKAFLPKETLKTLYTDIVERYLSSAFEFYVAAVLHLKIP